MHGVVSAEKNQSIIDYSEIDQNNDDAPSSTDNSDNEAANHEANGDSDHADNESSNNDNDVPNVVNALRNPNYNIVINEDNDDDTNNAEHNSDNEEEEEEEARSDSQRVEYDWNYAEQDSISDSDDYDWNFGYEEDQAGINNSSQNENTITQTTIPEKNDTNNSKQDGPSNSEQDSTTAKQDSQNVQKDNTNNEKPNETNNPDDINCESLKPDEVSKTENDNLKLFHSLELDESKNVKVDEMASAGDPLSLVDQNAERKTPSDQNLTDENKTSSDSAKETSEFNSSNTGQDCSSFAGRGAIRRTVQSSNRDRDVFNSTSRTAIRKSNQSVYNKSVPFGNPEEMYSVRGISDESDYKDINYADYINICASSYAASNSAENDSFSGCRSPNLSRYGNLNSPGFGDSDEHSYETEHSAVHEAPVNPEYGTPQTPTYSSSGTGYSGGGDPTSLSFTSPVSPSHGIQHTSPDFNTPSYDVPGWSDHRAPYSSTYEGPRSLNYVAPEISNYDTILPEYSSLRSFGYGAHGSSGFFAPGSTPYDASVSSRFGVPGLTGYVPSGSSNYDVSASTHSTAHYGVPGYSPYGPSASSSYRTSGSSGCEYGALAPSGYSAPISASYGAPELFDYSASDSFGYSTQGTPVYAAPGYYGYSPDYNSFGYCDIGSSGYNISASSGYDVSGSASYCPSVLPTYSTTHTSSCSTSQAPEYGMTHPTLTTGSHDPASSVSGNSGSSNYGFSNLPVYCVPVSSHYGAPSLAGFESSSSTGHSNSRTSRYGAPRMAGSSRSGVGRQTKLDEGIKSGDKANKIDCKPAKRGQRPASDYPVTTYDLGTVPPVGTRYRGFGPNAEAAAYDQGAGPVPGRGRAIRRGRSPIFGPIVPLAEIQNNRGRVQTSQYGPGFGQRPIFEPIRAPGMGLGTEPEQIGRGRGRGRGRRDANGN